LFFSIGAWPPTGAPPPPSHPSLELLPTGTPSRRREKAPETVAHLVLQVDIEDVAVGGVDDAGTADAGGRLSELESGSTLKESTCSGGSSEIDQAHP